MRRDAKDVTPTNEPRNKTRGVVIVKEIMGQGAMHDGFLFP